MSQKGLLLLLIPAWFIFAETTPVDGQISQIAPVSYEDASIIHLPCGIDIDPSSPSTSRAVISDGSCAYLVKFSGPIRNEQRRLLENSGAIIEGYIPNYTYLVRFDKSAAETVSELPGVAWVGTYEPGYKLCPEINLDATAPQEMVVILFSGNDVEAFRPAVEDAGGQLVGGETTRWETTINVTISPELLPVLLEDPRVKWIEPYSLPHIYNGSAQWVIQTMTAANRRIWDKGLKGEGQIINVMDSGVRTTHNFFRDPAVSITAFGDYPSHRKIISYQKTPMTQPTFGDDQVVGHGTHTSGSVLGNDEPVGGTSVNIGMAPEAKLYFLDAGSNADPYHLYTGFDLQVTLTPAYNGQARISSHSWGSQTTRDYNSQCRQFDKMMWENPDFLLVAAGGNRDGTSSGDYTGSPGNAKNNISVGATKNGAYAKLPASTVSSQGPTGDGRIRPDVVAPGQGVISSFSTSDAGEVSYDGTSMACPIVAGNAALIRQYLTDGWYPTGAPVTKNKMTPSAALLKAMVINSVETDFYNYFVPDVQIGWGRPKIDNVLWFPEDKRTLWLLDYSDGLETGDQYKKTVMVTDTKDPFRATLVWTDYPGLEYSDPALVNDLNLEVVSPSGKTYKGNNFTNNLSVTGGSYDTRNPVENVFAATEAGNWTVKVLANNVPSGPQKFALVVTANLTPGVEESKLQPEEDGFEVPQYVTGSSFTANFYMPSAGSVRIELFDASGRMVKELLKTNITSSGQKSFTFSTTDAYGKQLPKGVYFVRFGSSAAQKISKILLVK